jgi:hypothetical protein
MPATILVVADREFKNFSLIGEIEAVRHQPPRFVLTPYPGRMSEEDVRKYILEHRAEFDAVAVYNPPRYEEARRALEGIPELPRVLLDSCGSPLVDQSRYRRVVDILEPGRIIADNLASLVEELAMARK